ncbi:PEP-CTERM sorting domain-containing protein [Puniceicoccaceae bacterium K14]|nr:PEP-CTERM sorting domain-containing protein [Puniceicoccaceae bacterium K14]
MKNCLKLVSVFVAAGLASISADAQVVGSAEVDFGASVEYSALDASVAGSFFYGVFENTFPESVGLGDYILDVSFSDDFYALGGIPGGDLVGGGFSDVSQAYSSFTLADFGGFENPAQFLSLLEGVGVDLGAMSFLYDIDEGNFSNEGAGEWSFFQLDTTIDSLDAAGTSFNAAWFGGGSATTNIALTAVPEPSTIAGIGVGVLALSLLTYKRRKASLKR